MIFVTSVVNCVKDCPRNHWIWYGILAKEITTDGAVSWIIGWCCYRIPQVISNKAGRWRRDVFLTGDRFSPLLLHCGVRRRHGQTYKQLLPTDKSANAMRTKRYGSLARGQERVAWWTPVQPVPLHRFLKTRPGDLFPIQRGHELKTIHNSYFTYHTLHGHVGEIGIMDPFQPTSALNEKQILMPCL